MYLEIVGCRLIMLLDMLVLVFVCGFERLEGCMPVLANARIAVKSPGKVSLSMEPCNTGNPFRVEKYDSETKVA